MFFNNACPSDRSIPVQANSGSASDSVFDSKVESNKDSLKSLVPVIQEEEAKVVVASPSAYLIEE